VVLLKNSIDMGERIVYEYVIVNKEWYDGNLEKGTRLYYDYDKQGYVYHYERESTSKNARSEFKSFVTEDYFVSPAVADVNLQNENLRPGPELGVLEPRDNG